MIIGAVLYDGGLSAMNLGYFGDARLKRTSDFLFKRLISDGLHGLSVRRLGETRAGEIRLTRFLDNTAVKTSEMLSEAGKKTAARAKERHILAIQDTTVTRSCGEDNGGGDYLHVMLGVDAEDGTILGLVHADILYRSGGKKADYKCKPIEEKESYRWLESVDIAAKTCASAAQITAIADRESDIYEAFAYRPQNVHLIIRANHNRALENGIKLFETIDRLPEMGHTQVNLRARPGQPARMATLVLRFQTVSIRRPQKLEFDTKLPSSLKVNVIDVRESAPPNGATPVHWRLLTTHDVQNIMQALEVIEFYRLRWNIEQLFRTMKTKGFDIEAIKIGKQEPRAKMIIAALIAAIHVQQLVHARDGGLPDKSLRPLTDVFDETDFLFLKKINNSLEGKTAKQKNPHPEGSLAYAAWVCGRLGGWTGYYGKVGPTVMHIGYVKYHHMKFGSLIHNDSKNV